MKNKEELKATKKMEPITCPHCKKDFFIGLQIIHPIISSCITDKDIKGVKEAIIDRLKEIQFAKDKERENIIEYINSDDTILDASDIEPFIRQVAEDQIEKLKAKK